MLSKRRSLFSRNDIYNDQCARLNIAPLAQMKDLGVNFVRLFRQITNAFDACFPWNMHCSVSYAIGKWKQHACHNFVNGTKM